MATAAAFLFASQTILVKKALLNGGGPTFGALINALTRIVFMWPIVSFFHPDLQSLNITIDAIILFAISGVLIQATKIPRFIVIDVLGASVSAPIQSSTPFFAAITALFLLREEVTTQLVVAASLLILGVYMLGAIGKYANANARTRTRTRTRARLWGFILIALLLSVGGGVGQVVRKIGLNIFNITIFAAAVSQTAATITIGMIFLSLHSRLNVSLGKKSFLFFLASGIAGATALFCSYSAFSLTHGEIAIISALLSTSSLYVLILSFIFLRKVELLNLRIIFGCLIIVLSTILLLG